MPVQLRSITGKVDYIVEQQIRDLVEAVNRLEAGIAEFRAAARTTDVAALTRMVNTNAAQITTLKQQVTALDARVAALEP